MQLAILSLSVALFVFVLVPRTQGAFIDDVQENCQTLRDWNRHNNANDADEIEPGLWQGNICSAVDALFLAQKNVTVVISMAREWVKLCVVERQRPETQSHCFAMDDSVALSRRETRRWIDQAAKVLSVARQENHTVLVVCNMGVSRSSAVTLRYLMERDGLSYDDALERLQAARSAAQPNALFESVLRHWPQRRFEWALSETDLR